ncbi:MULTISPECIES: substrate-binding domain-containing protein [unclassified Luteococcus]|uniref:substrate-binding domain-containing protein n=1 Tax=unclassified Luteococcus TaxID=2639923 RepID=UPI00313DFC0B
MSHGDEEIQLRGVGSMATRHLLAALADMAADRGVAQIAFTAGGGVAVADAIRAGESADVIVLAQSAVQTLAEEGHLLAESIRPVFVSDAVLGVPANRDAQAPQTSEELRSLLLAAQRIGYSTGPSGQAFLALLDALGIREEVDGRLVQARPGMPVAGMLAAGEIDLGLQQLSEMGGTDGVTILGPLPAPHAISSVFSAAVGCASVEGESAAAFIDFLTDPQNQSLVERHGMTPATAIRNECKECS